MALMTYLNDRLIGELSTDPTGRPHFAYAPDWRASPEAMPLSLSLPLAQDRHRPETVEAVLWGLMPDDDHTIQRWASKFHVSARNPVALLTHIGEDCAGAVTFVAPDKLVERSNDLGDRIQWLDETGLEARLRRVRLDSGATREPGDRGQFSLAGAQPKLALLYRDGRWGIPSGRVPTTHILKPPRMDLPGLAENEHFCLQLAQQIGLPTASSTVLRFGDEACYCVERYDRVQGTLLRVHQEDFCQALGIHPQRKYQFEGGPSPKDLAEVLHAHSSRPRVDVVTLFRALVFNWIIGGSDAHAKNYSLLLGQGGQVRLAPLYDLLSVLPYPDLNTPKLKLAMKIGSHYRCRQISGRDWDKLAGEMRIDTKTTRSVLDQMTTTLPEHALYCAASMARDGLDHPILQALVDAISISARRCAGRLASAPPE